MNIITDQINRAIAENNGSARDALNVTLARLDAEREMRVAAEARIAQIAAQVDGLCARLSDHIDQTAARLKDTTELTKSIIALKDAEVAHLIAALDAANQDSALMDKLVMDAIARQTGTIDAEAGLAAHRAHNDRIGGAK